MNSRLRHNQNQGQAGLLRLKQTQRWLEGRMRIVGVDQEVSVRSSSKNRTAVCIIVVKRPRANGDDWSAAGSLLQRTIAITFNESPAIPVPISGENISEV
jgi:hypothetical protein